MSNHFHILLEVPPMAEGELSDEELTSDLARRGKTERVE